MSAGFGLDLRALFGVYLGTDLVDEEDPMRFGPVEYRPDPTEGITRLEA